MVNLKIYGLLELTKSGAFNVLILRCLLSSLTHLISVLVMSPGREFSQLGVILSPQVRLTVSGRKDTIKSGQKQRNAFKYQTLHNTGLPPTNSYLLQNASNAGMTKPALDISVSFKISFIFTVLSNIL